MPDDGVLGKFNDSIFETNFFYGKFTKIVSLILHNLLEVRGRKDKNKKNVQSFECLVRPHLVTSSFSRYENHAGKNLRTNM